MAQPLWKRGRQFLTKPKVLSPFNRALALLGVYPKELETYAHTETCPHMFIHNCLNLEATMISFSR